MVVWTGRLSVAVGLGTIVIDGLLVCVEFASLDGGCEVLVLQAVKRKNKMNIIFRVIGGFKILYSPISNSNYFAPGGWKNSSSHVPADRSLTTVSGVTTSIQV